MSTDLSKINKGKYLSFSKDVVFDPPVDGDINFENHDYVRITIGSSDCVNVEWFIDQLKKTELWDRLVVEFEQEENLNQRLRELENFLREFPNCEFGMI